MLRTLFLLFLVANIEWFGIMIVPAKQLFMSIQCLRIIGRSANCAQTFKSLNPENQHSSKRNFLKMKECLTVV